MVSPASVEGAHPGKTLLVVDDEANLLEAEAQILGGSGYRVLQAGRVTEALRIAVATAPIHLLLTDFSLPDGNGFDLVRRFRALHRQAAIILSLAGHKRSCNLH